MQNKVCDLNKTTIMRCILQNYEIDLQGKFERKEKKQQRNRISWQPFI